MPEQKIISSFKISALLALEQKAELDAGERQYLDEWLEADQANRGIYNRLKDEEGKAQDINVFQSFDTSNALLKVQSRINATEKPAGSFFRYYYVAAAVALISLSVLFYICVKDKIDITDRSAKSSTKNAVENIILSTPVGVQRNIHLPDGTRVWLSAESSLSYSSEFDQSDYRIVSLIGEAYFVVTKNSKRPFIVKTKLQEVEVIGTEFLIESYANDPEVKTSLYSGRVKVKRANKPDIVLSPGQQSLVSNFAIRIKSLERPKEDLIAKQEDKIYFEKESLTEVLLKIARWYDVEVSYPERTNTGVISGAISKDSALPKVQAMLAALYPTLNVDLEPNKRQIIITLKRSATRK